MIDDNGPTFDELRWGQRFAFALFFFAVRLWTRVGPLAKKSFGIKQNLEGGYSTSVPYEEYLIDNGHRSIKLTVEYMPEWEGEWDGTGTDS